MLAMVEPHVLLADGDLVPLPGRWLRAVWTPGHTPGHLCLHEETEDVLLTGDHVLPRISPNIGLQPHAADPPLAAYLESLKRIAGYDSAEALPAHEYRFHGLADRARMLLAHHDRRCAEVLAVTGPAGASHRLADHPGTVLVPGLGRGDRHYAPGRLWRRPPRIWSTWPAPAGSPRPGRPRPGRLGRGRPGRCPRHGRWEQHGAGRPHRRGPQYGRGRLRPGPLSAPGQLVGITDLPRAAGVRRRACVPVWVAADRRGGCGPGCGGGCGPARAAGRRVVRGCVPA